MAYMHKETFDIVDDDYVGDDDLKEVLGIVDDYCTDDYYFHVDDLIALPIQVLNRKGYITRQCCTGGHPFRMMFEGENMSGEEAEERGKRICNTYIQFEDGISLPTLPPGFEISFNVITKKYNNNHEIGLPPDIVMIRGHNNNDIGVYETMREVLNSMEQLYKWALNLPIYGSFA